MFGCCLNGFLNVADVMFKWCQHVVQMLLKCCLADMQLLFVCCLLMLCYMLSTLSDFQDVWRIFWRNCVTFVIFTSTTPSGSTFFRKVFKQILDCNIFLINHHPFLQDWSDLVYEPDLRYPNISKIMNNVLSFVIIEWYKQKSFINPCHLYGF